MLFDLTGGVFGGTEVSKTMTEIQRIQPNFSAQGFLEVCRHDIIPNVLEAIAKGNEEIVKDWCSEAVSIFLHIASIVSFFCRYGLC